MTRLFPIFALLISFSGSLWAAAETWTLESGEEYFGEAQNYDLATKALTIRKADGKDFSFSASDLTFPDKLKLVDSPIFGEALKDYSPPKAPIVKFVLWILLGLAVSTFIGVWGSAHTLGAVFRPTRHLLAYLIVLIIVACQIGAWLLAATILDPTMPVIIDKKADIVMTAFTLVMGLLVTGVAFSFVYKLKFVEGIAATFLAGVYSGIVATAGALTVVFFVMKSDTETLITRYIFEPFNLF